jgi:hypothetical protein
MKLLLRQLFNRRKHQRFFAAQKAYIVFLPNKQNERKLQIIDISEGGCGFIYHGDEKLIDMVGRVDLMDDKVPYLEDIFISVQNDAPATEGFRRRGVEFKWLGTVSKKELNSFIKKISIASVKEPPPEEPSSLPD